MAAAHDPGRRVPIDIRAFAMFDRALHRLYADVVLDLDEATAEFSSTDDPDLASALAALIATVHRQELRYDEATAWFDRSIATAPPASWSAGLAMTLKAGLLSWQGSIAKAQELVDRAESYMPDELRHLVTLQRAFIAGATDRLAEAQVHAVAARDGALRNGDLSRWAMGRFIEGRCQHLQGNVVEAEAAFRSILLRPGLPERLVTITIGWLGLNLARQGAVTGAINRFEQARVRFATWPRGAMEFGPAFASTYLSINLLDLAHQVATQTVESAIALDESLSLASALVVLARVDIGRGQLDSARTDLRTAHDLLVAQERPRRAEQARRLLDLLDSPEPPEWLTVEHLTDDPTLSRALLQLAHERPEASDRYLTAAAQGLDAPSGAVRAMARYGTILLELSAGRLEAAQAEVPRLLDELTRRTETIDALDVRAAGLELVDIRRLAVAFALAGRDDVLFQILEMHERATFDFALAEHDIGPLRSGLAALRTTVAALDAASVDTAELSDLDRRLKDLDGVRRVDRVLRAGAVPPMPRLGFVAANGRVYRATFDGDDRSFIDIGAAADLESLIRRLRFAVAAASMDPHGSERIDLTAHALQELLFAGITLADGEEYSIRPGQSLISVPWRLLPIARTNRVPLRIGSPYPRRDRAPLPQRILSVSCAGPGEHATTEATAVASHYPEATVLVGKAATPTAFLTACVDHDVVHIAGYQALVQRERLVTTLALGGGPLTMLDLGQVPSVAPIVVVASSRVTAVHSRTHDVNLALAQTLIARGAHEVVVSPVDLAPEHAVAVLPALHAGLAAGQTAVESLELLRFDDPELQRAADCLMCIEADHAAGPGTSAVER